MSSVTFKDMENYIAFMKLNPDVYGFIEASLLVGKKGSSKVFRLKRTVQYQATFSSIRDRMFAGLSCVYDKMYEMFGPNGQPHNGELKNYFAIAIETGNDIPRKTLSFDIYLIQAQSYQQLLTMPEFNALPGIEDDKLHKAVFAFGYQYSKDVESIDLTNKIFHFKVYKDEGSNIRVYDLKDNFTFDPEDEDCMTFVDGCFYGLDRSTYYIGMNVTDKNLSENGIPMENVEDSEVSVREASASEDDDFELIDVDDVLGNSSMEEIGE